MSRWERRKARWRCFRRGHVWGDGDGWLVALTPFNAPWNAKAEWFRICGRCGRMETTTTNPHKREAAES